MKPETRTRFSFDAYIAEPAITTANNKTIEVCWCGVLLLSAGLINAPRLLGQPFASNDLLIHLRWAGEFSELFYGGDPYPHWMYHANFGLGEPALLYYSPLFYYAVTLLSPLVGNVWRATTLVETGALWATGVLCYAFLRRFFPPPTAILGAVIVQFAPITFLVLNYINGVPFAVGFPLALWATLRSLNPTPRRLIDLRLSVIVAALICTHLLTAYIMVATLPFAVFASVVDAREIKSSLTRVVGWGCSVGIGLCLASFFLIPAVTSLSLITPVVWVRDWLSLNAFTFPLITAHFYGVRWFVFQWPVPLLLFASTMVTGIFLCRRRAALPELRTVRSLFALAVVGFLLSSELAYPLWAWFAPMQIVQFPYRFHYVTTIGALLSNSLVIAIMQREGRKPFSMLIAGGPAAASFLFGVALLAKLATLDGQAIPGDADISALYGGLREYKLATRGPGDDAFRKAGGLEGECARKQITCRDLGITGGVRSWEVRATAPTELVLPLYAFPAWQGAIDGAVTELTLDTGSGLAAIKVSTGLRRITVRWQALPSQVAGFAFSLLGIVMLVSITLVRRIMTTRFK